MKRSAALLALSREHHSALVWAKRAKRGGGDQPAVTMALLVQVFDKELAPHFAIEEQGLLVGLQRLGKEELVKRTLAEHDALRRAVESLRAGQGAVIEEFGKMLEAHVRFEERELFVVADELLYADPAEARGRR